MLELTVQDLRRVLGYTDAKVDAASSQPARARDQQRVGVWRWGREGGGGSGTFMAPLFVARVCTRARSLPSSFLLISLSHTHAHTHILLASLLPPTHTTRTMRARVRAYTRGGA